MRQALIGMTVVIGVALVALLAYSVERSTWLLSLYETAGEESYGPALAMAAAMVAELGAIALVVGEAAIGLVGNAQTARRLARWAGFGLLLVLSLQSVAGLVAGYTRVGDRMLGLIGTGSEQARFWVAAVALLLGNLTVPGLILALSKIAAILVGELVTLAPASQFIHARPAAVEVPIYVEPAAQTDRASTQRSQSATPEAAEPTEPAEPARDRRCKYCGVGGLTAIEVARHGRARARNGACP